jgi:pimeloyl-ACP methyl ester carboxylesterase
LRHLGARRSIAYIAVSLAVALVAACGTPGDRRGTADAPASLSSVPNATIESSPSAAPSLTGSEANDPFERVSFETTDGTSLIGRLWGNGEVGIILAHGFSELTGQDDWDGFQEILVSHDLMVLTFNFRGFCSSDGCSGEQKELGSNWLDVIAASRYLEDRGASAVFLVGASMGGIAVLRAARQPNVEVAGVISLSTPQFPSRYYDGEPQGNDATSSRIAAIEEPTLFVAAREDTQLSVGGDAISFAEDATRMHGAASGSSVLLVVEGREHGASLVTFGDERVLQRCVNVIVRFVDSHATS